MSQLQPVRGTQDILPDQSLAFRYLNQKSWEHALKFGYGEIHTPIFESSPVFYRTLGEASDIVSKETYTFLDRGGDSITLRPEGTAGIARAFISEGLAQSLPLRFYYFGPMFRYERPQKGRYRQFTQMGIELLGVESYLGDVEVITLAHNILKDFGLDTKSLLHLNTLGDQASRTQYKTKLVEYLTKYKTELSQDSQIRLEKNPLRILDSKDETDKKIIQNAPEFKDSLNNESKEFFDKILNALTTLNIPFKLDNKLVRGLDYYCHTVFEFITTELGAQGAILSGGRYDGLIDLMGGPKTPGVGWASGVERLSLLIDQNKYKQESKALAVIIADENATNHCLKIANDLRQKGYTVEVPPSGNMGKKMKRAAKINATHALIIGETELAQNAVTIKFMTTGEQKSISLSDLSNFVF